MKIGHHASLAVEIPPGSVEVTRDLIKDFLVIKLGIWVPLMDSAIQADVYAVAPQLKGKNYTQLVGAFSPLDALSDKQTYDILSALAKADLYTANTARHYMKRFEELGLISKVPNFIVSNRDIFES